MVKKITIAVDAMGGDNSPEKVIRGIQLHSKKTQDCFLVIGYFSSIFLVTRK